MRDLILLAIVLPGGLLALRYPFVGAMLWTWVSVMNPHRMTYGFMFTAPVAMFIGLCLLIGLLMTKERRSPFLGAPVSWFVALIAWMCITTLFAFDRAGSLIQLEKVLKIDLMILVVLMLVRTKREMITFAWVFTLSVVFFGFKGGIFTLLSGGYHHVLGPSGSYIEENNALAVALDHGGSDAAFPADDARARLAKECHDDCHDPVRGVDPRFAIAWRPSGSLGDACLTVVARQEQAWNGRRTCRL